MAVCECAFSPHSHTRTHTRLSRHRLCNSFNSYANVFYMESSGFLVRIIRTAHKISANAMETKHEKWTERKKKRKKERGRQRKKERERARRYLKLPSKWHFDHFAYDSWSITVLIALQTLWSPIFQFNCTYAKYWATCVWKTHSQRIKKGKNLQVNKKNTPIRKVQISTREESVIHFTFSCGVSKIIIQTSDEFIVFNYPIDCFASSCNVKVNFHAELNLKMVCFSLWHTWQRQFWVKNNA